MERGLLATLWGKLVKALRVQDGAEARGEVDSVADRLEKTFSLVSDGVKIRGAVFFPVARPARLYPAVILCHGIPGGGPRAADDRGYEGLADEFTSLGVASAIFNFRGCGESGGDFDMKGWTKDLEAVLAHVGNAPHIDPTRVFIIGFSGGGAAAIRVAADDGRIFGLAVVAAPSHFGIFRNSPQDVISDFRERGIIRDPDFPKNVDAWFKGFGNIEPRRWIAHFKGKELLVVHGAEDEMIPVEQARELFDRAPGGVAQIEVIPGGVHKLRLDDRCIGILKRWVLTSLGWAD